MPVRVPAVMCLLLIVVLIVNQTTAVTVVVAVVTVAIAVVGVLVLTPICLLQRKLEYCNAIGYNTNECLKSKSGLCLALKESITHGVSFVLVI